MTRLPYFARLFVAVSVLLSPALRAQPFLVEDINTASVDYAAPFGEFAALGGSVFFAADDGIHGRELWVSDGTGAGTRITRDICPGVCSSNPEHLFAVGGRLLFSADDGIHGEEIWKSDGTKAGTERVADLVPGSGVFDAEAVGGTLFYVGYSAAAGIELWRTDGTTAGTALVRDIVPGPFESNPVILGQAGDTLYFSAWMGNTGRELWKSDGTEAGTVLVEDLRPGSFDSFWPHWSSPRIRFPELDGRLFFRAETVPQTVGQELWVTDGTQAGTYLFSDTLTGTQLGFADELTVAGDQLFFRANPSASGWELWKTDGTQAGTVLVKDIVPGSGSSFPDDLTAVGTRLFFRAWLDGTGYELWTSDGTEAGTVKVVPTGTLTFSNEPVHGFAGVGSDLLFFAAGATGSFEPWKSDGTEAGTSQLADVNPGSAASIGKQRQDRGVVASGHWFFSAYSTAGGWGLWKSDGTPGGTQLVKLVKTAASSLKVEIRPDWSVLPDLFDFGGTLLFGADEGTGSLLWKSDGTEPGTSFVSNTGLAPEEFVLFGGKTFYVAQNPAEYRRVFSTDGTTGGTGMIGPWGAYWGALGLTAAGNALFFQGYNTDQGIEPWMTDGTSAAILRDIAPGPSSSSWADNFVALGNRALFETTGWLWVTDGTEAGTARITAPGAPSTPQAVGWTLTLFRNQVFFTGGHGGFELWRTDGSLGGTALVRDIWTGGSSFPEKLTPAGDLLFFTANDGTSGVELWKTDGTAPGTTRVADVRPGAESSGIREITAVGGRVFFAADDGVHGFELWVSDGTGAGTHLVEDVVPGSGTSFPRNLAAAGHLLVYGADDGTHGMEPWRSDGTGAGTSLVHDIAPGEASSSPVSFTLSGDYLYFAANDGTHGFEPWALDRAELGSALSARKTVTSPSFEEGTVTFEIVITNTGAGPHPDNPGDEMVDVVPAPLALTGASADVGTASVDLGQNRVAWNGALAPGESATVTIEAAIPSSVEGETFFNQATLAFDSDGDGTNESAGISDDPGRPGSGQSTPMVISSAPLDFHTVAPCRVFDTRATTPLTSGTPRTFAVGGTCGIPGSARAIAANLTAVGSSAQGRIVVYPAGITAPATSSVSFAAAEVRGNNAMLALAGGEADAMATVSNGGTVHLILDVTGYYE